MSKTVLLDAGPRISAETLGVPDAVIATTNVGHLSRFFSAVLRSAITA